MPERRPSRPDFPKENQGGPTIKYESTKPPEKGKEWKQAPSEIPEELQQFLPEVQKFIKDNQEVFFTIARDRSLTFKPGSGFFIDLKKGEINLDVKDWKLAKEKGLSRWQIIWSTCHEIAHYHDLRENPKEMLANFEYMEKRAKELAPQVLDIWQQKMPGQELPPHLAKGAEKFLFKKLHLLYNSLDDIYVNGTIGNRAAPFRAGTGSQASEVERLYRDYLFPTNPQEQGQPPEELEAADYATLPKSYQLAYRLLRKKMVPEQEILVDDEVKQIVEGYQDETAKKFNLTFEDQVTNITRTGNKKAVDPAWRYQQIRELVEPIFIELLMKDLEELPPPPPPQEGKQGEPGESGEDEGESSDQDQEEKEGQESKEQEGQAESSEEELGKSDEGESSSDEQSESTGETGEEEESKESKGSGKNPWEELDDKSEPIDLDTIRDFIKQQEEKEKEEAEQKAEEERKARLTPEEKAQEAEAKEDAQICEKYNVTPKLAEDYRKIEHSIRPYKREIAAVFEQLMNTVQQKVTRFWAEGFKTGKFNVDRLIRKYGTMLAAERPDMIPWESIDVYDQKDYLSRLVLFPDKLRTRLVLDGSGSMGPEKILALKQLSVLLLESLSEFESVVNLRFRLKDPIQVDTEIRMFGSEGNSRIVKSFSQGKGNYEEERADRFKSFGQIHNNYGSTYDTEAIEQISSSIDLDLANDLKNGKAKEFVFEITDGGADVPQATRNALADLEGKGVIARGFQIGNPDQSEKEIFDSIWGEDGERVPHPKDLAAAVGKLLAEEIKKTEMKVGYYEEVGEEE